MASCSHEQTRAGHNGADLRRLFDATAAELAEQARELTRSQATAQFRRCGILAAECHRVARDLARARVLLEELAVILPRYHLVSSRRRCISSCLAGSIE